MHEELEEFATKVDIQTCKCFLVMLLLNGEVNTSEYIAYLRSNFFTQTTK